MPDPLDLNDDDGIELAAVLREAIARDRYFLSPRVKRLRAISTGWSRRHHDLNRIRRRSRPAPPRQFWPRCAARGAGERTRWPASAPVRGSRRDARVVVSS
jgi:hypothetical protein